MRLLLDTHTLLWFGLDDRRLSDTARGLIEEPANEIAISPASYSKTPSKSAWESTP